MQQPNLPVRKPITIEGNIGARVNPACVWILLALNAHLDLVSLERVSGPKPFGDLIAFSKKVSERFNSYIYTLINHRKIIVLDLGHWKVGL